MKIQILGSGCDKCRQLAANAGEAVTKLGVSCEIEKVTDITKITEFGVMITPALVLDGKVISAGKVLSTDAITVFLKGAGAAAGADQTAPAAKTSAPGAAPTTGASCGCGCGCGSNPAPAAGGACCAGGSKKALTVILLAFVVFSVVAMIVRQSKNADSAAPAPVAPTEQQAAALTASPEPAQAAPLVVYYFHGTMRCKTCNAIEALTQATVTKRYAKEMADGKLVFMSVNYDEAANEHFIKDFELSNSTVVVQHAGQHRRLDAVWELIRQPDQFGPYIEENINALMEAKNEQ